MQKVRVPVAIQSRVSREEDRRIGALASKRFDGNRSMAIRHVVRLGLRALENEKRPAA